MMHPTLIVSIALARNAQGRCAYRGELLDPNRDPADRYSAGLHPAPQPTIRVEICQPCAALLEVTLIARRRLATAPAGVDV